MKTLEQFEKRKYDRKEQVVASTSSKRPRVSAESPPRRIN